MSTVPPFSETPTLAASLGTKAAGVFAGFWRRLFAFALDMALLAFIATALGGFYFEAFARLGSRGPLVGFALCLLYFGTLNSSIGNGQTLGKKWRRIRVVDRDGQTISPGTSYLRAGVLFLPLLHGAILPEKLSATWAGELVTALFAVIAVAIVYLDLFNRGTRQSLHDLAAGTYVVRASSSGRIATAELWPGHSLVIILLLITMLVGTPIVTRKISQMGPLPELLAIQHAVQETDKVREVSVTIQKIINSAGTRTVLQVNALWSERPKDMDRAANEVASRVLAVDPRAAGCDTLVVAISFGYDIGIAHGNLWRAFEFTPVAWQQKLSQASAAPQK